jgi:hypothetical protein
MTAGGLVEGVAATEAEANRKNRCGCSTFSGAQMLNRGSHVETDGVGLRLHDFRPEVEIVFPARHAGRAPEVVEGGCMYTGLGEAKRQIFVKGVKTTNVGKNDYPRTPGAFLLSAESSELVAVRCLERQRFTGSRSSGYRRIRGA